MHRPTLSLLAAVACATLVGAWVMPQSTADTQRAERSDWIRAAIRQIQRSFDEAKQSRMDPGQRLEAETQDFRPERDASPPRPTTIVVRDPLVPFKDFDYYYVKGNGITWTPNTGQAFGAVHVPNGFVTDLASIPRAFWSLIRPEGRHAYAAVVHDYLYWIQARPRLEADEILRIAMQDSDVGLRIRNTVFEAVRAGGQLAWDENAQLKKKGERRILKQFPPNLTISWTAWKRQPGVFTEQ